MTSEREREIWDDPESEDKLIVQRPTRGPSGKPVCFGCYGSMSECRENEEGIIPCPWANLCVDPNYPRRYD